MPRTARNIVATERDLSRLHALKAGADPDVALRASIVLGCLDGRDRDDVARENGVTKATVSKWRGRFAESGVDGLRVVHGGGRARSQRDAATLDELVRDATGSDDWTVAGIAADTGSTGHAVKASLDRQGLGRRRAHSWDVETLDGFAARSLDLRALYLSEGALALVACSGGDTCGNGRLSTCNRALALEARSSSMPLTLADALVAAGAHASDHVEARRVAMPEFVSGVLASGEEGAEFHVVAYDAAGVSIPNRTLADVRVEVAGGADEWASIAKSWLSALCPTPADARGLSLALDGTLRAIASSTEPFRWSRSPMADAGSHAAAGGADLGGRVGDAVRAAAEEAAADVASTGGLRFGALLFMGSNEGVDTVRVEGSDLPDPGGVDWGAADAFARSVGLAEEPVLALCRDVGLRLLEMYVEQAKKAGAPSA